MRPDGLRIVQDGDHRASLSVPPPHHPQEIDHRPGIDGRKGFVEQHELRVLKQEPCEERALKLPARQRADGSALEPGESDRRNGLVDPRTMRGTQSEEAADLAPQPHRYQIDDRDRERPVNVRLLRQVGDIAPRAGSEADVPGKWTQDTRHPFQQRRLARAVGPHDGGQAAVGDLAVELMHRRMPVIAQGQILECQRVGHGAPGVDVAQKNMAQSDIAISIAAASLGPSPMRSVPRTVLRRGLLLPCRVTPTSCPTPHRECYNITNIGDNLPCHECQSRRRVG